MPIIEKIEKPEIRLVGDIISSESIVSYFSTGVDHSTTPIIVESNLVSSPTVLDRNDLLNFQNSVRIIITGKIFPKVDYRRRDRMGALEFEGNVSFNTSSPTVVNEFAETFYTLNGKDPVRTANYLYTALDYDSFSTTNLLDPSANPSSIFNNINDLGFLLKVNPTGDEVFVLKARTFYRGQKSDVTTARFKVYRNTVSTLIDNAGTDL